MAAAALPRRRPIVLDAMGGDQAPREVVAGAVDAVASGIPVILVGRRPDISAELDRLAVAPDTESLRIVDASEVVAMDDHPARAVRTKRDSSIVRGCELVAGGDGAGMVSAGNSGAVLAAAVFVLGRIGGIARPAIGARLPSTAGETFVLDVGANADCRPEWLAQFGLMGSIYARAMMGIPAPRVALLSNGEEAGKGNELVLATQGPLAAMPVDFVGNVEGRDLFRGRCDVAVTDGFTGNVLLKTAEGVAEYLFGSISRVARTSAAGRLGGLLLAPRLRPLRERVDYRATGGALLLGVSAEVVIAHGRSDRRAIANAIRVAARASEQNVSGEIAKATAGLPPSSESVSQPAEASAQQ